MLSFSSTFTFGLQTDFYQIELSRVRVDVEFQSFMIPTNITIWKFIISKMKPLFAHQHTFNGWH